MKWEKVAGLIISLSVIYLVLIVNVQIILYNEGIYKQEFVKYDAYSKLDDPESNLQNIFDYFKHKEELDADHFTPEEISHMDDVRRLIDMGMLVFFLILIMDIGLIISLAYKSKETDLLKLLRNGTIITLVFIFLLVILGLNFSWLFTRFHQIFFKPGTWTFSTSTTLIKLFPFGFWKDMFTYVLINSAITAVGILALSIIMKRTYLAKKETKK